jgi:DNA mismatch repair protein MutS
MAAANNELTPMKRQYNEIKERNQDCILFFRLGDFYEMFDEDARVAAKELDLTLTTRDRNKPKEEQTPMCGVPYHSVDAYIARLVQKGYKVAICEQMQDPATTKGLVERDITRIVTPGTVTESCMLDESRNNYIGCIYEDSGKFGLAFCDVSTGAFFVTACADVQNVASELGRFAPSEVIRGGKGTLCETIDDALFRRLNCCVNEEKPSQFDFGAAEAVLECHFGTSMAALGLGGNHQILRYVFRVQKLVCAGMPRGQVVRQIETAPILNHSRHHAPGRTPCPRAARRMAETGNRCAAQAHRAGGKKR